MTALIILFLLLAPITGIAGDSAPQSDRIRTIQSLEKLDDFPLYTMHFYGDYDLPDYDTSISYPENLGRGIPSYATRQWACTCFSAKTDKGNQLLGRNFDWSTHPALLLFTDPPGRYASVSVVDISYLGYSTTDDPAKNPGGLLRSPLLPFDGLNEKGLAVGMMAVPQAAPPADPQKRTVHSLLIIRLMLDHAKNVDEAIAVFENFNIVFQGGPPLHYFVTDKSGRSAVIELVSGEISVLRNTHPWQVATNFILTGLSPEISLASCWRYKKVWQTLENQPLFPSHSHALSLLESVSQGNTIWSVVYDTASLDLLVVMGRKYDRIHKANLKQALSTR